MFDEFVEDFEEAELCGVNLLAQKEDGSCIYLKAGKCSIHDRRPQVCKEFFCKSENKKFKEMIRQIRAYKENGTRMDK